MKNLWRLINRDDIKNSLCEVLDKYQYQYDYEECLVDFEFKALGSSSANSFLTIYEAMSYSDDFFHKLSVFMEEYQKDYEVIQLVMDEVL